MAPALSAAETHPAGGPGRWPLCLAKPPRDAGNRLAHFLARTGVAKAKELAAVNRIEGDAGGRRDARLLQHLFGKLETVGGELRDVRVEVECAVGGQEFVQTGLRQPRDQNAAVLLVAALDFFHFRAAFARTPGGEF